MIIQTWRFPMRPFPRLGTLAFALFLLPAAVMADDTLGTPRTCVSDDGQLLASEDTVPSRLLFGSKAVPLPAAPDWTADSVRAIGGMKFADPDGDNDLDLVLGNYQQTGYPPVNEYQNEIHFNTGGVLETSPTWIATVMRHTGDVRVADVNGDGYEDLYFANGGSGFQPSTLYLGGPGGPATTPDWLDGTSMWTVGGALADLDGDEDVDLVQANQGISPIPTRPAQVFYGNGATFETFPSWVSADSVISNTAAAIDLDGSSEVAVTGLSFAADGSRRLFRIPHASVQSIDRVEVVPGPTPRFTLDREAGRIFFASAPAAGRSVEVDYTYALYPDVAFARWVNYATAVYHNSSGTLPATPTWTTGDPGATDRGLAFSDVDADGDLDMGLGSSGDPTTLWRNDGGVLTGPTWMANGSLYFGTQEIAWGDVDADGDDDLATIEFGNGHLRVFLNQGGTLETTPSWFYDFSTSASSLAWGDVNGDGFLDLAAGTARGPAVVFLNTGALTNAPDVSRGFAERLEAAPNPFLEWTTISGIEPGGGDVEIFDVCGRRVAEIDVSAGASAVRWDGRDEAGGHVSPGVYFVRQEAEEGIRTARLVRVR